MKTKLIAITASAMALALFLGGCVAATPAPQKETPQQQQILPTQQPETVEPADPASVSAQANDAPSEQETTANSADPSSAAPAPANPPASGITMEDAKRIALNKAQLKESEVEFVKTTQDRDDGRYEYDIEFVSGNTKYEFEIDKETGDIRQFSTEAVEQTKTGADQSQYIGAQKAKEIALAKAGLSASQVTFTKIRLDSDDGRYEYEVEFVADGKEHEFEIDAKSGAILQYEIDQSNR